MARMGARNGDTCPAHPMIKPNGNAIHRYRMWIARLRTICAEYKALERLKGTTGEDMARSNFRRAALRMDDFEVPPGYRSWEHLGDAIHGPGYRHKTW